MKIAVLHDDPDYAEAVVALRDRSRGVTRGPWLMVLTRRGDSGLAGGWSPVVGPALDFPLSCTNVTRPAVRALMCPDPWSVIGYSRPRLFEQPELGQRLPTTDLHEVNWRRVSLPGGACGSSTTITARKGDEDWPTAFIHGDVNFPWWNKVVASWDPHPVFGDIDGDGRDEAAVDVVCANDGGTADGQLRFSVVVFKADGQRVRSLGVLAAEAPLDVRASHVPLGFVKSIGAGQVVLRENWYGPYDGTAGGSGEALTTWSYQDGRLVPSTTQILVPVWRSPVDVADLIARPTHREIWPSGRVAKVPLTKHLSFAIDVVNQARRAKRNVRITVTIDQRPLPVVRQLTIRHLTGWGGETVHLRHLSTLRPGRRDLTVDIQEPGAHPVTYRVELVRP